MFFKLDRTRIFHLALLFLALVFLLLPSLLTNSPKLFPAHLFLGAEKGFRQVGGWLGYAAEDHIVLTSREAELYAAYLQLQDDYLRLKEKFLSLASLRDTRISELPMVIAVDVIIPWDSSPWRKSVVINAGSEDGIEPDLPVVYGKNVVGRISEVGPYSSRVQLVTDPGFHIEVAVLPEFNINLEEAEKSYAGILNGSGEGSAIVEHILRDVPVKEGWVALSMADLKGYWRPGLVLGRVTNVSDAYGSYLKITATPEVDLSTIKSLLVLKFPRGVK